MRRRLDAAGYGEVKTPQLVDRSLWEASGHWENFGEHVFTAQSEDERTLALEAYELPCHVQIFRQGIKSYRDLPLRMAEFGSCHRNEPSGACMELCVFAPSLRTMRIFFVPKTRSMKSQ